MSFWRSSLGRSQDCGEAQALAQEAAVPAPSAGRYANLIVASTFYHVILACLIARDARFAGPSLLVVNARRDEIAALYEPLATEPDSPFAAVRAMPEFGSGKRTRERAYASWLARLDAAERPERVLVFSDLTPHIQLLCRHAERRGARTFCAEDGGTAYSSRSWATPWRRHIKRLLDFGPWVQNIAASGSSRHVQVYLAMHPQLVRPELQAKRVWPLSEAELPDLLGARWLERFLAHYAVGRDALACDELYTPGNSRTLAAGERAHARLRAEIRAAAAAGLDCVVKYHPRERGDFLQAVELGARTLPPAIPAELIYLASGRRLRRVVGIGGTTLLSARWLVPHARAVSVLDLAEIQDPWYARTLDRLGVQRLS